MNSNAAKSRQRRFIKAFQKSYSVNSIEIFRVVKHRQSPLPALHKQVSAGASFRNLIRNLFKLGYVIQFAAHGKYWLRSRMTSPPPPERDAPLALWLVQMQAQYLPV